MFKLFLLLLSCICCHGVAAGSTTSTTATTTTTTTIDATTGMQDNHDSSNHLLNNHDNHDNHNKYIKNTRKLQSADITDATQNFIASTESTFDHMVTLEDNLSFHWNDVQGDDTVTCRLIHKADSIEQAPSWLGFGIYHSNHNYTTLPTENFMIGSTALIGLPTSGAESSTPALRYHLGDKFIDAIEQINDDESFHDAVVFQHDSDDGTIVTELTFTKSLEAAASNSATTLRKEGTNIFLWAVGAPGVNGRLAQHALKGVMYLDFMTVQQQVEGTSPGLGGITAPTSGSGGGGSDATTTTTTSASDSVNTSPVIRGKCGSSILEGSDAGQVSLTPTLVFHWVLLGPKIQVALEYTGRQAWLGVATSKNGKMIGSSAVIGIPGDDDDGSPKHYLLNDKEPAGVVEDSTVILEDATIISIPSENDPSTFTTTLQFTKFMNDPNDPVPIVGGSLNTFLFAVGSDSEALGYHEHRGSFRIDLEECGGTITLEGAVWTHHGLFATHGFFAVLAWALSTPFAVTVAWFRTLVPASWIYIHVFANVLTFVLTFLVFIMGIMGVSKEDEADHFTHTHHWIGMLLFFVSCFQLINGFLRPPVERKDAPLPPQDTFLGIISVPRTPRETWQTMHRLSGLTALIMGIYQIQSGLKLYSLRFQTASIVKYYWIYVVIFFGSLIALKVWVVVEENKARQGVMEAVSTQEPTGPGGELGEPRLDNTLGNGPTQLPLPPELPAGLT